MEGYVLVEFQWSIFVFDFLAPWVSWSCGAYGNCVREGLNWFKTA